MSNESQSLQERLEDVQEEYRRRHLSDDLNDIAETMEETILQRVLAKAFFEESVEIDAEAKEGVEAAMQSLNRGDFETIEAEIDDLEEKVESAATTVENRIQELRLKHNSTVAAMRRLNDRVDRVNEVRLEALEGLLDDWRWKEHVYLNENAQLDDLKANAREYGEEMRLAFDDLKDEMFGVYPDEIRDLIYRMIDDERLSYADLSETQRRQLAESDIGEYIELTLS
jgi:hypothetical protein